MIGAALATWGPPVGVWLVGFVVVSAAAALAWAALGARIAGWHPLDRARVALGLATAPVWLPSILLGLVLAPGVLGLLAPSVDHCTRHPDHPHLCLVHPAAAIPAAMAGAIVLAALVWLVAVVLAWRRAGRGMRTLRSLALLGGRAGSARVAVVDAEEPLALTFGVVRPRGLVSTGLLTRLDDDQRSIVLAHEAEHARRYDPLRQLAARLASVLVWPSLRRSLLDALALASEEVCDARAAIRVGDRLAVADAILAVERRMDAGGERVALAVPGIGGSSVARRVEALLDAPAPRRTGWPALLIALPIGLLLAARPLHHELEHALAWLLGAH